MAIVDPGMSRAFIEHDGGGLRITIRPRPQLLGMAFMGLWLIGWAFGEVGVGYQFLYGMPDARFLSPGSLFVLAWLALWTLGGLWCAATLLWNVAGNEVIELNLATLKRIKRIPIFSRSKAYRVASIANLRVATKSSWRDDEESLSSMTFSDGAISFDMAGAPTVSARTSTKPMQNM